MLQSCGMPPSSEEGTPLSTLLLGGLCSEILYLFSCYLEELGSTFPSTSDPQY